MKIASLSVKFPSLKVTNDNIIDYIKTYSNGLSKGIMSTYLRRVVRLLKISGSDTRYILDRAKGEKANEIVKSAMEDALEKSGRRASDIDLLIYCGVGKGFLEPANAYFYANDLNLDCSCFDVADACMSWIRALEIAYRFLQSGQYKNIMIINGEFNANHGLPQNFVVKNLNQLEYTFPTYTIGEAASATLLVPSDREWSFSYKTSADLCDLCTIPLQGYEDFVSLNERIGKNGIYNFVAYGGKMFDSAEKYLSPLLKETVGDLDKPAIYFPHAASSNAYTRAWKKLSIHPEKMYTKVFPAYGNLVSASIPAGMQLAITEGRLKRGDKVVFCPASAGMVFSVVQFVY